MSAQCPLPATNPGSSIVGQNEIGASRRKVAKAPSRTSSSSAQKSREPSSISAIGTSGGGVPFTRVAIAVLRPIEILLPPSPLKG
ncbi:Uncharacterised protein [Mycobacterium tuberculosis]|uniref:Uncharacterized protein n=1 Tax=Mycobacterium tuberculosis TaxID=1773 RepID=A0A655ANG9_MYCTX|nr:Uncharacterised protein [Mycobacterium tuberculosis]CFE87720.1 Uncharacterised protein [Mycobacterium tuberculosis]CFR92486.1 Uncharacterised protein [Mycobacterium tuberculosis]CKO20447.1 Uncharacterised protein [Mycobacterium tuberculosis]CKR54189.1 Uncharacterised protein [Mycobacterium tuberculosis]